MKMISRKLAMPLLGMLLWVISIHAGTFAAATLLPRPITGFDATSYQGPKACDDIPINTIDFKIPGKEINRSVTFGNGVVSRMHRLETSLGWSNIHVKKGTPSHGQLIVSSPEREALKQGREALVATKATIHLMNGFCSKYNLGPVECSKLMTKYSLHSTSLGDSCRRIDKACSQEDFLSRYRSIDGYCNHNHEGSRGGSFTGYKRLLFPEYLDGVQEPRRSASKKPLPSARLISTTLVKHPGMTNLDLTLAVVQWSQFIEHDLSHTATSKMVHTETTIECCAPSGNNLSPRYIHPFCSPISIPHNDPDYAKHGLDCMTYVRSVPAFRSDCSFGPIEQVNQATHFIDGSQVYGTNTKRASHLRTYVDGEMEVTTKHNKVFLPLSKQPTVDCQFDNDHSECFISGDSRVNVHPHVTAMHTIWLREHNRIARQLKGLNPKWDDETLYQEARRIVIAEIQHITYDEWLPVLLGKKFSNKVEKYSSYNENVNPSVSNSFATAALRAINSLMDDKLNLYKENRLVNISLNLRNYFNKPDIIEEPGYLDGLVRGLATQSSQKSNDNFVDDISSQLFSNGVYGYDVFSLDIQRGRDHGLPSYTAYRTLCGLPKVESFSDFLDVMSADVVKSLSDVYKSPQDVDLIVGGIAEKPVDGSSVGPTFSCIISDQFLRTRRGDRYYYSNEQQPHPLSKAQLKDIEKVSLARIFCNNADDIQKMQPAVFRKLTEGNQLTDCSDERSIPKLNLSLWSESRESYF